MTLLAMQTISKRFGGVQALNGVNLEVRAGEVHALVGENGAGKSTLMHILAGVHQPDDGKISWDGQHHVLIANEHAAQQMGIAIVFQERSLFTSLTVAENIFAGRQPVSKWGMIDRKLLYQQTTALLRQVGLTCSPKTPLNDLSSAQQQMVEIAKALSLNAKLIIFDEPTAALTEMETAALFRVIGDLKKRGVAIIYISHRLEEVFKIADRVTVLKDGAWQGTFPAAEITTDDLITRMVGRGLSRQHRSYDIGGTSYASPPGQVTDSRSSSLQMLEVRQLNDHSLEGEVKTILRDIGFQVRRGEIVAMNKLNIQLLSAIRPVLFALLVLRTSGEAYGQIQWRISVKFILGANGELPGNSGGFGESSVALTSRQAVINNINYANELLDRTGRGFRFNLTEVQNVSGASGFFNLPARDGDGANKAALEAVVTSNATSRAQFFWRDDAINVYINNTSSGYCSFPGAGNIIFIGSASYDTLIIHECGHFFQLLHTHNSEQFRNSDNSNCADLCGCAQQIGGDDGIADTVLDNQCWDQTIQAPVISRSTMCG